MHFYNEVAAVFILRIFLGLLFFMQGYDKVFKVKIKNVVRTFQEPLKDRNIATFLIVFAAYYTSIVELVCGFFLIIGFMKYYALYLLGIDLLMVCVAFSLIKPMWDMQYVFPRLILLIALLLLPAQWDALSMDYLIGFINVIKELKNV